MPDRKPIAQLGLSRTNGNAADFTVTFTGHKNLNRQNVWVACNSYDAVDVHVGANFAPVAWDGDDGTVTVGFVSGARSEAFACLFPDVWTPRSNTVEF